MLGARSLERSGRSSIVYSNPVEYAQSSSHGQELSILGRGGAGFVVNGSLTAKMLPPHYQQARPVIRRAICDG